MPPAHASCWCLGTHECSLLMHEPCSLTVVAKYFFIRPPQVVVRHMVASDPSRVGGRVQSRGRHGDSGALPGREAGSGAAGCIAAPEPSRERRQGPELRTRGRTEALPNEAMGSDTVGHATARGHVLCFLLWLGACMRGYPVYRVPIVALGPTSSEAANQQVGPASFPYSPSAFSPSWLEW
jgi:hypothetical protein